ncbi:putative lipase [Duganella levis]|uniref:DUF676 domain-containing protein n=1 Tax=Duganella levis TaxID=2692169 RepID=A0ABW9W498_9BURK|nr:putative lipase [Duganella levis]MYN28788.1 hypothetical protein [Duganella levis]
MQAKQVAESLIADLREVKEAHRMDYTRRKIATIEDADERALATAIFLATQLAVGIPEKPLHLVILIHGIRTRGTWQDRVASWLKKNEGVKPVIVGFDYFDIFSFWFPRLFREGAIEEVERKIRAAQMDNKGAIISVIAHSFGTYVLSQILSRRPDLQLHRVLLCGAIVSTKFPWDNLRSYPTEGVLNDVGTRDVLPAVARTVSWGYGNSGTFGFRSPKVEDRYFNFTHSDFFTDDHIQTYWVPYIVDGKIVESAWTVDRPTPPWWLSVLHILPMKSVIMPSIILGIGYAAMSLWKICS